MKISSELGHAEKTSPRSFMLSCNTCFIWSRHLFAVCTSHLVPTNKPNEFFYSLGEMEEVYRHQNKFIDFSQLRIIRQGSDTRYEIFASIRSLSATIAINSELVGLALPTLTVLPNRARIESTLPRSQAQQAI